MRQCGVHRERTMKESRGFQQTKKKYFDAILCDGKRQNEHSIGCESTTRTRFSLFRVHKHSERYVATWSSWTLKRTVNFGVDRQHNGKKQRTFKRPHRQTRDVEQSENFELAHIVCLLDWPKWNGFLKEKNKMKQTNYCSSKGEQMWQESRGIATLTHRTLFWYNLISLRLCECFCFTCAHAMTQIAHISLRLRVFHLLRIRSHDFALRPKQQWKNGEKKKKTESDENKNR